MQGGSAITIGHSVIVAGGQEYRYKNIARIDFDDEDCIVLNGAAQSTEIGKLLTGDKRNRFHDANLFNVPADFCL